MSESDRHLRNLLLVKARDKAYVTHTSDSLILDCLDYYSSHKESGLYPEVLYYCGRVYYDLGDYPTTLSYLQKALDAMHESNSNDLRLKSNIMANAGNLLYNLRIYNEAIPYVKAIIDIDKELKDTMNLAYDYIMLGGIYSYSDKYDSAELCFEKAYEFTVHLPEKVELVRRMNHADLKLRRKDTNYALKLIRGVPDKITGIGKNSSLSRAAMIYHEAGIYDTAYIYAKELIGDTSKENKKWGFKVLLSPELRKFIPEDSLQILFNEYKSAIEGYVDANNGEQIISQNSKYNYSLHYRERIKAEKESESKSRWIITLSIFLFLLIIYILIHKNIQKKRIIRMQKTLYYLVTLQMNHQLVYFSNLHERKMLEIEEAPAKKILLLPAPDNVSELRNRLMKELDSINENLKSVPPVPKEFLQSDVNDRVLQCLREKRPIPEGKTLWEDTERTVLGCSPDFRKNLLLLSDGNVDDMDYRMALLIRCGFGISKISVLMGRVNSTISTRRSRLGKKLFGTELDSKSLFNLIRML